MKIFRLYKRRLYAGWNRPYYVGRLDLNDTALISFQLRHDKSAEMLTVMTV